MAGFLYHAASMTFVVACNPLFLLYVVLFSASLFAFVLTAATFDLRILAARVTPDTPCIGFANLLFVSCHPF
jgi:hypothetical protein